MVGEQVKLLHTVVVDGGQQVEGLLLVEFLECAAVILDCVGDGVGGVVVHGVLIAGTLGEESI